MLYLYIGWVLLLLLVGCVGPLWLVHKYLRCMGVELRLWSWENDLFPWTLQFRN